MVKAVRETAVCLVTISLKSICLSDFHHRSRTNVLKKTIAVILPIIVLYVVFFLITRARDVVHFLVQAKRRGLFAQGYVFITVDFKISSSWEEEFFQTWGVRDYDDLSVNYLQGLVYVSSIDPDQTTEEFKKLMNEARERLKLAPFYNTSVLANKTVRYFIIFILFCIFIIFIFIIKLFIFMSLSVYVNFGDIRSIVYR